MEEEKKQGGFLKGFFCATLLFLVVAIISLVVTISLKADGGSQNTEIKSGLVTQDKEVQEKLGRLE